jgi:dihydrofolate reductase
MGLLTFSINVTLDGCVDHQEGIVDDDHHAFFTRLMNEAGAMLWGRVTYEMMESYWPAVARGDEDAPPAIREWAVKLEAELDRLHLIDEYKFLVHPRIAGHGPTLYQSGLPSTRRLELVSATPLKSGAVAMRYRRVR